MTRNGLLVLVFGIGCGTLPSPEPGLVLAAPPSGQLIFTSDRAGLMAVFAVDVAGGKPTQLTPIDGAHWFSGPVSPAGDRMAWLRSQDGPGDAHMEQLVVVGTDGMPRYGPSARAVRSPSWSPDGRAILVESSADGFRDVVRWDGLMGPHRRLTEVEAGCFEPQFTADGLRIVMVCSGDDLDLRIVPSDRATPHPDPPRLLERKGEDIRPSPHPSLPVMAFAAGLDGQLGVWTANLDGSGAGPAWVPEHGVALLPDQGLAWSADGGQLAVVVRSDGGRPAVRLLSWGPSAPQGPATVASLPGPIVNFGQESPSWMPDGTLLLTVDQGGNADLWRIEPTTGAHESWADGIGTDWLPRWWPAQ